MWETQLQLDFVFSTQLEALLFVAEKNFHKARGVNVAQFELRVVPAPRWPTSATFIGRKKSDASFHGLVDGPPDARF